MTLSADTCQISVHFNPYAGAYGFINEAFTAKQMDEAWTREEWIRENQVVRNEGRNMAQEAMQYETKFYTG